MTDTAPVIPWTFGVGPLAQTVEVADRLRRVTGLVLSAERPDPAIDALIRALDEAERALAGQVRASAVPRVGASVDSDNRVYIDHSRDVGSFHPFFPEYDLVVEGDRATGTVNFPIAFEGPPGLVHGGYLALFFDTAIQQHNCDLGLAGKTTKLALRYRRPTPLGTDLRFELTRSVDETRIHSTGTLRAGETVVCEAEMNAVKGDRSRLPAVSPRRASPGATSPGRTSQRGAQE
ncbi:Thioesterase domain-containing protein [Frankia sp. AiPs1]|uniref:PaaI family thioesterase n=1 Tax=Frankia sp. AiPa1 TaxID=573492 RepID=UPI00202B9DF5|nr:hypothetical protein [Frankia sp. AiPa1]MCL9761675.1 hypothetical protein [Frankia sp. AiPa1]